MILLWTDAGPDVGLGHVSRGLALADELARRGAPCRFALPADVTAREWLRSAGHVDSIMLPGDAALPAVLAAARDAAAVVADVRAPLGREAVRMLGAGRSVVDVDNAGPGVADADVVVAPFGQPRDARWLAGPAHVPLRRTGSVGVRRSRSARRVPTVLVSMGASDPTALTVRVAEALADVAAPRVRAHVVANPRTPVWSVLPALLGRLGFPPARPIAPGAMAAHLAGADVAVLALGVTVYEALAAGVSTVVLCRNADDEAHARSLEARDALVCIEAGAPASVIAGAVCALLRDSERRAALGRAGHALVDGRGAARIVDRLLDAMAAKEGDGARRLEA